MASAAGRVLVFTLVTVLVLGAVGLAASQTFINKTGGTVTGITVEFSKSVIITRHDSVFPDQDPNGRSDEFTFSGGELRNLGRFSITWIPSSGKVTSYEWIEKSQPAQTSQATSPSGTQKPGLPDPNTPPILYGDDYPGSDEALYQPKDDEQIWLTDLEGHGDIYDNDSIKINYAPGFDKSQITKINVYRNMIKLSFLPDKLDVLTNAQMKTFDGNRLEHSPASNHTDHAIMGYEYEFKIQTADHLWIMKKTLKSGFRWQPKEMWAELGISWSWNRIEGYSLDEIVEFLNYLKQDGFTGISIGIPYYVITPYDDEVLAQHTVDPDITNWGIVTPTESELEKMLKAASSANMEIYVRGNFYISQKYQDDHGTLFGGAINPKNPEQFFENYADLLLKFVPLLNKYHVKLLTPFTEMDTIEKYPGLIKEMYTRISEQLEGEMGFEEAINNMLTGNSYINPTPIHTSSAFERLVKDFTFWNWEDSHGRPMRIEYSCQNIPVETQMDQQVSVMTPNFVKFWSIPVSYYSSTYPENPQMFGELGVHNVDGQVLGPDFYHWPASQRRMDEQERADYILAALMGTEELHTIISINYWGDFNIGDSVAPATPWCITSTGHYSRPASPLYRVLTAIIKPEGN